MPYIPGPSFPHETKRTILSVDNFYADLQWHTGTASLAGFVTAINVFALFKTWSAPSSEISERGQRFMTARKK